MTLSELTTPYEAHKVFTFSSDGKRAVQHNVDLCQIHGSLYMTQPRSDTTGSYDYAFYICFPEHPIGMVFQPFYHDPSKVDVDVLTSEIAKLGLDTAEHFIQELDRRVTEGLFISVVQISMASQIRPDKSSVYVKARDDFYARREQEDAERARIEQEEEQRRKAEEAARYQAEVDAARRELMGWGDRMPPLQLFRIQKTLNKQYRYDGVIKPRRQFVIDSINDGYKPEMRENVTTFYGSKWDVKESKPRTEYRLADAEGGSYLITKTEYDFALYLYNKKNAS